MKMTIPTSTLIWGVWAATAAASTYCNVRKMNVTKFILGYLSDGKKNNYRYKKFVNDVEEKFSVAWLRFYMKTMFLFAASSCGINTNGMYNVKGLNLFSNAQIISVCAALCNKFVVVDYMKSEREDFKLSGIKRSEVMIKAFSLLLNNVIINNIQHYNKFVAIVMQMGGALIISDLAESMLGRLYKKDKSKDFLPEFGATIVSDVIYKGTEGMFAQYGVPSYLPEALASTLNNVLESDFRVAAYAHRV